ncbi:MAG: elongation factor P--(R)-beta-lysine ligase [Spirochaetales bacterium]|nr:elongation factor P--(R)-beta-lysine ligase [Spirochaetales bacterium]
MIDFKAQRARAELYRNIRSFFSERDYLEVFTPTLSPSLIPEPTIKTFSTQFKNEFVGEKEFYLIPSPEIFMKEMIAKGSGSIFQISSCFRNSEQLGDVHNPEFSMLEYYTMGYSDKDSIKLTHEMIKATSISDTSWLKNEPLIITMEEAMKEYAGVDLIKAQEYEYLKSEAERLNLYVPSLEDWEDTFNRIFLTYVEPNLPKDREVYLCDYPAQIECLAKNYPDRPYKKRWEMYIKGIEIANCYDEETDKEKILSYYKKEQAKLEEERKLSGDTISAADLSFAELDMPECSGGAIGLDRLLLVEYGGDEIAPILSFPMCDMLKKD